MLCIGHMASCIQDEEKRCRLCLEGEDDGPLVQPCACRGSAKLAHKHCLERWRRESPKEDAAYRCGQCCSCSAWTTTATH